MAIYHLSMKPVSRGAGRSATAAAAYRAGELVHDLTTDQVFDYTRKRGVEHSEIVLPSAAARADINWARDRQALWNAAEVAERRKDARVAREYEVALPHELHREQRVALVRSFAGELANRYGVAVDFAIHAPHREGDARNHHAHILATTRELTATGLGAKALIEWSDTDRAKHHLGPAKEEVKAIRAQWAALTNQHLLEQGLTARIDHRSFKEQGIGREPTSHLGPAVSGMERRGMETQVGQRLTRERAAAAAQRVERAGELAQVREEQQALKVSILDLSAALELARRERGLRPSAEYAAESEASRSAVERLAERVQARAQELKEQEPGSAQVPGKRRGRFEGLKLRAGRSTGEREALSQGRLSAQETAPEQLHPQAALHQSLDRYARAWMDAWRMHERDLPVLEHQKSELHRAGEALERERPGATDDLFKAIRYEPGTLRVFQEFEGPERTRQLLAGLEQEERIRRDPNLRAERLVKEWNHLEGRREKLKSTENEEAREEVKGQVRELALELKLHPELEMVLKSRAQELGIEPRSRLGRVLEERNLERALQLSERELGRGRHLDRDHDHSM
jgi:hypothetical protein